MNDIWNVEIIRIVGQEIICFPKWTCETKIKNAANSQTRSDY